jgi:hypothetical protein
MSESTEPYLLYLPDFGFTLFKAPAWPRLPVQFVESRLFVLFLVNFACFQRNGTNFAMTSG